MNIKIELMNKDLKMMNGYGFYVEQLTLTDEDGTSILDVNGNKVKFIKCQESVKCGWWGCIQDYYTTNNGNFKLNENGIYKNDCSDGINKDNTYFMLFREYSKEGFEKFIKTE
jgi:hypothetical protein